MTKIKLALVVIISATLLLSCNNAQTNNSDFFPKNKITQQPNGSIALHVEEAECYRDEDDPSTNTAEWNVVVSKSGRFDVWLSSATIDTVELGYKNKVLLNVHNNVLEIKPVANKVVKNAAEVKSPYFRADSFMGSMHIQDTGLYLVQIISDKILSDDIHEVNEKTKLLSVILTPVFR
jgi:hypothetical protein